MIITLTALVLLTQIAITPAVPANDRDRREAYRQYQRGQELLGSEQWDKAVDAFRSATKLDPDFTDAYYGLGRAYMGGRRFTSAVMSYQDCIEAARRIYSNRERDRAGTDQLIADQIRALREAIATIQRQKTGQVQNQTLQVEARIAELERSRSSRGGPFEPPAEVMLALGSAHFRNGDSEAARSAWEASVKVNAKLGEAWNNLAVVYMQAGRKKDAEAAVRNAEKNGFRVNPNLKNEIKSLTLLSVDLGSLQLSAEVHVDRLPF